MSNYIISGDSTGSISYGTISYSTPLDSGIVAEVGLKVKDNSISPKLYVSYVKSKIKGTKKEKLQKRIAKLQKLVANAKDMGQRALYENLTEHLVFAIREQQAFAIGCDKYIEIIDIDKYKNRVRDKVIKFDILEKFPRLIPVKVRKKIKAVQSTKVFDELWVLYIDYTGEHLKTNSDKIKEKDPILFGKFNYQKDKYYYITDWIDDYCDLTLDKFVDAIKEDHPEYELSSVPDITPEYFDALKNEVIERQKRLDNTNRDNFRQLAQEANKEAAPKKKWWKFW